MPTIKVTLPRLHMAGAQTHHNDARIEVGQHGLALFLSDDASHPLLDIEGTPERLNELVRGLQVALHRLAAPPNRTTH